MKAIRILLAENPQSHTSPLALCLQQRKDVILTTANSGIKAVAELENQAIDLVLLDLILPDIGGMDVLKHVNAMDNRPIVMLVTPLTSPIALNLAYSYGVLSTFIKPFNTQEVVGRIIALYVQTKKGIVYIAGRPNTKVLVQQLIQGVMLDIGVPSHLLGYSYMRDAVLIACQKDGLLSAVTTELYPKVALMHGTTAAKVERSLRHAVEATWNRANIENLHKLFGYSVSMKSGRPTNSEFIARVTELVTLQSC